MAIVIGTLTLLIIGVVALLGYAGLAFVVTDLVKYVPEWRVIRNCRKKGNPLISLTTAGSGESIFVEGTKNTEGDPIFDSAKHLGVRVDPQYSGMVTPNRYPKGLTVYHYCPTLPFAIDARNALSIQQTIQTVRNKIPELSFLTNDQLMSLLCTDRDDLPEYTRTFMSVLLPEAGINMEMGHQDFLDLITDAQDLLSKTAIRGGWVSYAYAFANISTAYSSQAMGQYGMLIERLVQLADKNTQKKYMFMMFGAICFAVVVISGAIAYTIISG